MPRTLDTPPSAQPDHPNAPVYHYDPNLGGARDKYTRADFIHANARQPEVPGVFVAVVEGETVINTMWGHRSVAWRAEPGTPCIIRGYWADGTVHLQWPAIGGHYSEQEDEAASSVSSGKRAGNQRRAAPQRGL